MTQKPQPPPAGLSARSKGLWRRLHTENAFTSDSAELLERALRSFDLADELLVLARTTGIDSPKARSLLSAHRDALQTGLKLMKGTGLDRADADARRRPGRPAGADWSPIRRQPRDPLTGRVLGGTG